jgi:hypothetical protein
MIGNYLNINVKLYLEELNKKLYKKNKSNNRNKKYECKKCSVILSSYKNYINHLQNNICEKKIKKCKHCKKNFVNNRNLNYHIENNVCRNYCDNTTNQTNQTNTANTTNIAGNLNNIGTLNNNIGTLNNNINNNIQINVSSTEDLKKVVEILPFRETGYKVTTEKYLEYASNPDQAIKQFIKEHHFNPEKPERMNILNTNRRDNRVQLFDYDEDFICRWQTKDKGKIMELLYDRGMNHLFFAKMMLDCAGVKLDPNKENKLKEKIKEYEDDKVKKQCLDMIADMTYDYREMIEINKKSIEKQQKLLDI